MTEAFAFILGFCIGGSFIIRLFGLEDMTLNDIKRMKDLKRNDLSNKMAQRINNFRVSKIVEDAAMRKGLKNELVFRSISSG